MRIIQQNIGNFTLTMILIGTWKLTAIDRVNKRNNTLNTPAVTMIVIRMF